MKNIHHIIILIGALFSLKPVLGQQKSHKIIFYTDTTYSSSLYWKKNAEALKAWADTIQILTKSDNPNIEIPPPAISGLEDLFNLDVNILKNQDSTVVKLKVRKKGDRSTSRIFELEETSAEAQLDDEIDPIAIDPAAFDSTEAPKEFEFEFNDNFEWSDEDSKSLRNHRKRKPELVITNFRLHGGHLMLQPLQGPTTTVLRPYEMTELQNGKSLNFCIDQNWGLNLFRGKIRFWYGLSYSINNYRFSNSQVTLTPNAPEFESQFALVPQKKSKLVSNYIGIPISIGFQDKANDNYRFKLNLGIEAGYLVRAHTKIVHNNDQTNKVFDDFNLNDFVVQPTIHFQYEDIAIFAKYALTSLFKPNQGADYQKNMVIGVALNLD